MKITVGTKLNGTYSNGVQTWNFSGTVTGISNDTAGGNFATARILLDTQLDGREAILATLDHKHLLADSRYDLS